jgi:hypothetical protein
VHIAAVVLPEPPLTCAKVIIAIGQSPTSLKPRNPDSPIQRNHDSGKSCFTARRPGERKIALWGPELLQGVPAADTRFSRNSGPGLRKARKREYS